MQTQTPPENTGDSDMLFSEEHERITQLTDALHGEDRIAFLKEIDELKKETSTRLQEAQTALGDLNTLVKSAEHKIAKEELSAEENSDRKSESERINTMFNDA